MLKNLLKGGLISLSLLFFGGLISLSFSQPVLAQDSSNVCDVSGRYLLGIPSWDRGLRGFGDCEKIEDQGTLDEDKFEIIITNITAIATHVAAFIAVGFVIFGGFLFILSSGNTEKTTKARKTIINAAIGLVIAIMARVITEIIYKNLTGT